MAGVDDADERLREEPTGTTRTSGSRTSPATTRWTGSAATTSRRSPSCAASASSRCAPRHSRCSTPMRASRTSAVAATTCTTSGATRPTRAGCGGAPRWTATARDAPDWDVVIDLDELAADGGRELGVGGRQGHRTRSLAGADHLVARRLGCRGGARVRHAHRRIRRRRLRGAGGQDPDQLGGRGHRADRHGLRRGLADRVRVSAAGQALASRAHRSTMPRPCSAGRAPTCSSPRRGTARRASSGRC